MMKRSQQRLRTARHRPVPGERRTTIRDHKQRWQRTAQRRPVPRSTHADPLTLPYHEHHAGTVKKATRAGAEKRKKKAVIGTSHERTPGATATSPVAKRWIPRRAGVCHWPSGKRSNGDEGGWLLLSYSSFRSLALTVFLSFCNLVGSHVDEGEAVKGG